MFLCVFVCVVRLVSSQSHSLCSPDRVEVFVATVPVSVYLEVKPKGSATGVFVENHKKEDSLSLSSCFLLFLFFLLTFR